MAEKFAAFLTVCSSVEDLEYVVLVVYTVFSLQFTILKITNNNVYNLKISLNLTFVADDPCHIDQ